MSNPLISAYRKPALYINLPSGGKYYNPPVKLSVDKELAIYAMTARDELITKTPDALFNGEATVSVIESCAPDIPNPRQIPINDLLVIMLAIRQASYGNEMDITAVCPSCKHDNLVAISVQNVINTATNIELVSPTLTLENDFVIKLSPYNLEDRTNMQIQQIKQMKMIEGLQNQNLDDKDRQTLFGKTFVEMAELTVDLVTNCVDSVQAPGSDNEAITDKDLIREWLANITSNDYEKIKNKIDQLSDNGIKNTFNVSCEGCGHKWSTDVELDMANFFEG